SASRASCAGRRCGEGRRRAWCGARTLEEIEEAADHLLGEEVGERAQHGIGEGPEHVCGVLQVAGEEVEEEIAKRGGHVLRGRAGGVDHRVEGRAREAE